MGGQRHTKHARRHATMHDGEIEPKNRTGHSPPAGEAGMLCPYEERRRARAAGAAELLEVAAEVGTGG